MTALVITATLGFMILLILIDTYRANARIKRMVRDSWGEPPVKRFQEDRLESVEIYWEDKKLRLGHARYVDDTTWSDLDMNLIFSQLNSTFSSVGAEYLYARLHELSFDQAELQTFDELVGALDAHEVEREQIAFRLGKLGKNDFNGVPDFIFAPSDKRLSNMWMYYTLGSLPLWALVLALFNWQAGLAVLVAASVINIFVYYQRKFLLVNELNSIAYMASLIACSGKLRKISHPAFRDYAERLAELHAPLKKVAGMGAGFLAKSSQDLDFISDYIKILFMYDFINYNRIINTLCKHTDTFHSLWQEIGRLDAAIAVASYRRRVPHYTTPVFTGENELAGREVYHPLVDNPVCNPLDLVRNTIITGSNASGKSTYIKAVAVNCIFAQSIYTCLAVEFKLRPSLVLTSMAVRDDVAAGDSYFIAEIKSLRRVLRSLSAELPCLCFIDEILKGTNTIERIAASSSILGWLEGQNCLCVVASHDIELTEILSESYDNVHFREQITDEGIVFDYKLYPGKARTKNAIKLLDFMDYPREVIARAQRMAEDFETARKWAK